MEHREAVRMQEPSVQKVSDSPPGRVQSKTAKARFMAIMAVVRISSIILQVMIMPIRPVVRLINGLRSIVEHGCYWIAWMRLEK